MEVKSRRPFSNLKSWKWQNVILLALMTFYLTNFGFRVATEKFPFYAQDFFAYWSVGKIADVTGYSKVYDLNLVRSVETDEMIKLGLLESKDDPNFSPIPASYLSIFIIPFQFLSRIEIQTSATIWLIINFLMMIAYLFFFHRDPRFRGEFKTGGYSLLLVVLFSYPVFDNFLEGQINVFLMICVGEFIRNAVKGRPFISGLWLAGLLLKPPLLILLLPILLIMRYWKVVFGFMVSSLFVLTTSWVLSGTRGMIAFTTMMLKIGSGGAASSPQYMINWRMVGVNLNAWTHSNIGWIVMVLGMLATLGILIYIMKNRPVLGSIAWVMAIMGAFSATLAFTWHVHNHTAMIMIPLLIYAILKKALPVTTIWSWVLVPTGAWLAAVVIIIVISKFTLINVEWLLGFSIAMSGFLANQILFLSILYSKRKGVL
ncbi:MAG: glycosyltransferase family 87 protein [Anaerolineaceae bacterium]